MTTWEEDHERVRRAEAFHREYLSEISEELRPNDRPLRPERSASLSDSWECFAASGKIGDYLEFVRRRDQRK